MSHRKLKLQENLEKLHCKDHRFYIHSCQKCTELNFAQKILERGLVYISGYEKITSKVTVKCQKCNHEFSRQAQTLTQKGRCPVCHKSRDKRKKSLKEHLKDFEGIVKTRVENGLDPVELFNGHWTQQVERCIRSRKVYYYVVCSKGHTRRVEKTNLLTDNCGECRQSKKNNRGLNFAGSYSRDSIYVKEKYSGVRSLR